MLLKSLISALEGKLKFATLDSRLQGSNFSSDFDDKIFFVRKSIVFRFFSLWRLARKAAPTDILLCFNSLPPLIRPTCRVILFVQAPHFANMHRTSRYTFLTSLRIFIERIWFNLGSCNCDEIIVQTLTMANTLRSNNVKSLIRVLPFADDNLVSKLKIENYFKIPQPDGADFVFFYPADALGHKNHLNLLKAWAILNINGYSPTLLLTLNENELNLISSKYFPSIKKLKNLRNLNRISRDEVLDHLAASSALIFPSRAETLGLPMLEARALGVPIIASERDFVRDVCIPAETFDPESPNSIASSVMRFMGVKTQLSSLMNANQFVSAILYKGYQ